MTAAVIAFAGAALTTGAGAAPSEPRVAEVPKELSADGAWSWFGDPRAVRSQGKTFVGWLDSAGTIKLASYDHTPGGLPPRVVDLARGVQIDDHNNPSILVRADGRLMVFWSEHNGDRMNFRTSTRAGDITDFGPRQEIRANTDGDWGFTYPNPIQLTDEGNRIYLFWRGGNANPTLSIYDNGQWSRPRTVIRVPNQRPYVKYAGQGGDTIGMAFTEAHPRNLATSIYYAQYRNGAYRKANGDLITPAAGLPFTPAQAGKVYDAGPDGPKAWVHDVAFAGRDRPVIVFATVPDAVNHRYWYARFDGDRWNTQPIVAAGGSISEDPSEPQYSGGITLDHENPAVVYLSRKSNKGVLEIERRQTNDGGRTWDVTPITQDSPRHNYRPVSPRGGPGGDYNVIWMHGRYPSYQTFQTGLCVRLDGAPPTDPCTSDRLDIFSRDTNNQLVQKTFDRAAGGWQPERPLGNGFVGDPTAVSWGPLRNDVFALDAGGQLIHRTQRPDGTWTGWVPRGGALKSSPDAASAAPRHITVVAQGTNDRLTHNTLLGGQWTGWRDTGRVITSAPTAVSWGFGRIDTFARSGPNQLLHGWADLTVNPPQYQWETLDAPGIDSAPDAASWGPGRLDIVARDTGGNLMHRSFQRGDGWSQWRTLQGPITADPTATSWGANRLDVSARAPGGQLVHRFFTPDGDWSGWTDRGGVLVSAPDATTWNN